MVLDGLQTEPATTGQGVLSTELAEITRAVEQRGLRLVKGWVSERGPSVVVDERWDAFLDLAKQLGAHVVYLHAVRGGELDGAKYPAGVVDEHADDLATVRLSCF